MVLDACLKRDQSLWKPSCSIALDVPNSLGGASLGGKAAHPRPHWCVAGLSSPSLYLTRPIVAVDVTLFSRHYPLMCRHPSLGVYPSEAGSSMIHSSNLSRSAA